MSHVNPSNTSITLIWSEQWRPLWWLSGVGIVFLLLLIPLFWIDRRRAWSMCVYGCAPFLVLVCHSSTHGGRLLSHRLTLCCVLGAAAVELPPVGVEASSRLVTSHKKDWPSAVPCTYPWVIIRVWSHKNQNMSHKKSTMFIWKC